MASGPGVIGTQCFLVDHASMVSHSHNNCYNKDPECFLYLFQNPWIVSIKDSRGDLHCGGSIVSGRKVVTAAHCFADKATGEKMSKNKLDNLTIVYETDSPFAFYGKSKR